MAETTRILAGVTPQTYEEMQLGPGIILVNFAYEDISTVAGFAEAMNKALAAPEGSPSGWSLGGTRGGINVNVTPTMRQRDIDGVIARFVGDSVIDNWECYISGNLVQFSPKTMQAVFPSAEFAQSEADDQDRKITAMRIRTAMQNSDWQKNMCWIGTTDYGWIMFALHNALGQTTGDISTESAGEATIPFRADGFIAEFDAIDYAPCEIWIVDRVGTISKARVGAGEENAGD